jgi:hypothetical protein
MRSSLRASLGVGIAGLLIGLGVAFAQPATNIPTTAVPAPADGARAADMTPRQMRVEANRYLPTMEQGAQAVRRQLDHAREQRDVVKVLCLNDKLTQIDVALRSVRERVQALGASADREEVERVRHEFTVVQVLRDRIRALVQESNLCIGEEMGMVGDAKVTVEIDPSLPGDDPTDTPPGPIVGADPVVSDPPVVNSPNR